MQEDLSGVIYTSSICDTFSDGELLSHKELKWWLAKTKFQALSLIMACPEKKFGNKL